jgi:FkbM family methyltransferase
MGFPHSAPAVLPGFSADSLDATLEEILSEPVSHVQDRETNELDRLLDEHDGRCVIFGAGNLGRRALSALRSIGIEPLALSDNNPDLWGRHVHGAPLLPPEVAAERYGRNTCFFIAIRNEHHHFQGTFDQLTDLGCRWVSSSAPILWRFPHRFPPFLLYGAPHRLYQEADRVLLASEIWTDDASRAEYIAQVRLRALGDARLLRPPTRESYVIDGVFDLEPDDVLVDCGAYDGDTVRDWIARQPDFGKIEAVEADSHSFAKLVRYVADLEPALRGKIRLHNYAIGAQRGKARFEDSGEVGSKFSDLGPIEVDVVPLDTMFASKTVSMIKMDIEGAEFDALMGARQIIERDRPILAICVYHSQQDLWRIPLQMKAIVPEYRMYLRCYRGDGMQCVAFAVPPERVRE